MFLGFLLLNCISIIDRLSCSISFPHRNNTLKFSLSFRHSAIRQTPCLSIPLFLISKTCKVWFAAKPCASYLAPLLPILLQSNYNLRNLHSFEIIKFLICWAASTLIWLAPRSISIRDLFSNIPCNTVYRPSYFNPNFLKLKLSITLLFLSILVTWYYISCPTSFYF